MKLTQADASGGLGSVLPDLRSVLTRGLSLVIDGEASKRYGAGAFNDRVTVNASGEVRPAAAPSSPTPVAEKAASLMQTPMVAAALVAAAVVVVVLLARR